MSEDRLVRIFGGGTTCHIKNHLSLCAPAYGDTAMTLGREVLAHPDNKFTVMVHLSKMALVQRNFWTSRLECGNSFDTAQDLFRLVTRAVKDPRTKIIFFSPAVLDFEGYLDNDDSPRGKNTGRLSSSQSYHMTLKPVREKIVDTIRKERKDLFLVSFKTTCGATLEDQYIAGLNLLKRSSSNLVLANDSQTHMNMIVTPEEASYAVTSERIEALQKLVNMAITRSHLTFTRSTVVDGESIPWESPLIPGSLRTVVNHCIEKGAYKKFRGVTSGHFAVKLDNQTFLTSKRKTDFNDLYSVGLVKVTTDGPDTVLAYGAKPSVGGQSQRIVFYDHPGYDCIVHFHCTKKPRSNVHNVPQWPFECGSHECGKNTSMGLKRFGRIKAVFLENHGPNILFNSEIDPKEVIEFIEEHFDLTTKTGGFQLPTQ